MKHFALKGQVRQVGNKAVVKAFRKQGLVPCNLYGNGSQNVIFTVNAKELNALLSTPNSYIVDIDLGEDGKRTAVLHELQFHPVTDICLHVDFLSVDEEKPIAIEVPVNITGHAAGVQAGGKFVQFSRKLKVSAQMKNLPDQLDVDITNLGIGERITAGDLKYDDVAIISPKTTIICSVKATRQMAAAAKTE